MMNLLRRLPHRKEPRLVIDVAKVTGSRATYVDRETSHILLHINTTDGDLLTLEFTVDQGRQAIETLTHSYYAIVPPLANRRTLL